MNSPRRRLFLQQLALAGAAGVLPHAPAQAQYVARRWLPDQPAPAFAAQDLDGKTWRLADLRGRAVVLNFWASWCEPCRAEMPTLQQIAEIHGPDKLVVLAINFKESAAKAAQFVKATGLTLPVLLDPNGEAARQWDVRVFPSTMLIAADGRPRMRIRGEVDWSGAEAEKLIAPLLKKT